MTQKLIVVSMMLVVLAMTVGGWAGLGISFAALVVSFIALLSVRKGNPP